MLIRTLATLACLTFFGCASKGQLKRCVAEVKDPEVYLCEEQAQEAYRFCKSPKNIFKCEDIR